MRDHSIPCACSLETPAGILSFELDPDVEAISRRRLKNPELLLSAQKVDVRTAGGNVDVRTELGDLRQESIAGLAPWLIKFVEHRVGDRRIIRLVQKWLKAGILEDGIVTVSDKGSGRDR
jgi:hypothetical protein